jgi:ABC-type branched-subunit amino acid transport system ATPase component
MVNADAAVGFGHAYHVPVLLYGHSIASDVPASIKQDRAVQTAYLGTAA